MLGTHMPRYIVFDSQARYSVLLGDLAQNESHRHYSMHLGLGLRGGFALEVRGKLRSLAGGAAIAPNVVHRVPSLDGNPLFLMSFSPISRLGLHLGTVLHGRSWAPIDEPLVDEVRSIGLSFYQGECSRSELVARLSAVLSAHVPSPFEYDVGGYDPRIVHAVSILSERSGEIIAARELAAELGLSESRFLHLFRSQVGVTYRRMQIWFRLISAFRLVTSGADLTEVAHATGFADNAHFSRSFRQTFGMSPSTLLRDSRFVQADG